MTSLPTPTQQQFLTDIKSTMVRWVVADNQSGKSTGGARECAWLFNNSHPFFDRPAEWGTGPIKMIVLGKKNELIEEELWKAKVKPLLGPGNYREVRNSSGLQKVINEDNGNVILFQSHNNPEEARKNIQGHVAHWVWLDEMPESSSLVSELIMRIIANNGRLVGTFTPLVHNVNVRKIVDRAKEPEAKKYHFSIYDNPKLAHRIAEVIEVIRQNCASEAEFKCRVGGEWMAAGTTVSCYDPDKHLEEPTNYDVTWRHSAVVDPSASGLTGLTLWGEDPTTGVWYNVLAKYLNGDAAYLLVGEVEKEIAHVNVVIRVCDPNPAGFYREAARQGITYRTISEKAGRKHHLIDGSNKALATGKAKLTKASGLLEDELSSAAWSETAPDRIVNASSYHTFDTFQYAADTFPTFDPSQVVKRNFSENLKYKSHMEKEVKRKKEEQRSFRIYVKNQRRMSRFNRYTSSGRR